MSVIELFFALFLLRGWCGMWLLKSGLAGSLPLLCLVSFKNGKFQIAFCLEITARMEISDEGRTLPLSVLCWLGLTSGVTASSVASWREKREFFPNCSSGLMQLSWKWGMHVVGSKWNQNQKSRELKASASFVSGAHWPCIQHRSEMCF